jgi:hypothetical protein
MPLSHPRRGLWLKALTDAAGVADAALIVLNKSTRNVVCFPYLSREIKTNYVRHYNAVDPYSPLLDGGRKKLPECLLDSLLRTRKWYNDFVLTCGAHDILGVRPLDTLSHCVIIGIHQQIGRSFSDRVDSLIDFGSVPLKQAARRHVERFLFVEHRYI